jgi:Subtilase family
MVVQNPAKTVIPTGNVAVTEIFNPLWLEKYGLTPQQLAEDSDHDGKTNKEEMFANSDSLGGATPTVLAHPSTTPALSESAPIENAGDLYQNMLIKGQDALLPSRERAASLRHKAEEKGIPTRASSDSGSMMVLTGIDDDGNGIYATTLDAGAADGTGADELWPTGSWNFTNVATGNPAFINPTGSSGLGLSGTGEVLRQWEAGGGARTSHASLTGRVLQVDAGDLNGDGVLDFDDHTHATEVASQMIATPLSIQALVGAEVWDLGSQMRGIAFGGALRSFYLNDMTSEIPTEAAGDLANSVPPMVMGNFSFGTAAGWLNFGVSSPEWHWFGPAATTATEDFKFGAYLGSILNDVGPQAIDTIAQDAPTSLLIFAAGNDGNQGPVTAPGTYFIGAGTSITSTAVRDFVDGDVGGYDSLAPMSVAKNTLTVGSVQDIAWDGNSPSGVDVSTSPLLSSFSSYGPTDDGRIKPEVVAPGSRNGVSSGRNIFASNGMMVSTITRLAESQRVPTTLPASTGKYCVGQTADGFDSTVVGGAGMGLAATASDAFHYVKTSLSGDVTMVARVDSQVGTGVTRQAGIMIRETTGSGSSTATAVGARSVTVAVVGAGTSVQFIRRTTTGGNAVITTASISGGTLPRWIRLERVANAFTAAHSADGITWTAVGTAATVAIPSSYWAGLVASNRNANNTATAQNVASFSRVAITTAGNDAIVSLAAQGTSYSAPAVTAGLSLVTQRRRQIVPQWYAPSPAGSSQLGAGDFPVRSSTLRALAVHTAIPVRTAEEPLTNFLGPDFKHGFGIFNAKAATELMAADAATCNFGSSPKELGQKPHVKEIQMVSGGGIQFDVKAKMDGSPLKVTMAWNDPAGPLQPNSATTGLDPNDAAANKRLRNDLDLRVFEPGNANYTNLSAALGKPWLLDPSINAKLAASRASAATVGDDDRNNLEQVVIQNPVPGGTYKVVVRHKGASLTGSVQTVSLVMSGNDVNTVPFEVVSFYRPDPTGQPSLWLFSFKAPVGSVCGVETTTNLSTWTVAAPPITTTTEVITTTLTLTGSSAFVRAARFY